MNHRLLPILLCAAAVLTAQAQVPQAAPAAVKGGGARMTRAEVEQMIQDREDRLMPTSKRRDFKLNPEGVQGWAFRRRALLDLLYSMKDQSDDAPVYLILGHTPNLDGSGKIIAGTWHETIILCESRPFYAPATGPFGALGIQEADTSSGSYYLQHPAVWP